MKLKKLFAISAIAGVALLASCNNGGGTTTKAPETTTETTTKAPDPTTTVTTKVLSYDEYLAAEVGSEVTIEAYITGRTTWYNNAASFYLADDNGGYYVYNLPCTEEEYASLLITKKLQVTGAKAEWKGEIEINCQTATENTGWLLYDDETCSYSRANVTSIAKEVLDDYKNQSVKALGLTVTKAPYTNFDDFTLAPAAGADVYFEVKDDAGNTATYVVEAYLENSQYDSDVYNAVCALKVGDRIDLEGFVYYWENPQLQVTDLTKVFSYDEYIAAAADEEVTIQAYITSRTTWYNNAASFYLADDHGGYYVYNLPCTEDEYNDLLVKGAFVEITGAKSEWKGEVEINGQTATENAGHVVLGATKTYEAILVNDIAKSTLDLYKNQLVKTKTLTVTKAPYTNHDDFTLEPKAGADVYVEVTDGTNTFLFVVEAYLEDSLFDSDTYRNVCNLHVGDTVVLEGFIYYWENPQMQITKCDTVA